MMTAHLLNKLLLTIGIALFYLSFDLLIPSQLLNRFLAFFLLLVLFMVQSATNELLQITTY